ncbi:hypothetical protein C8R44DRAFT_870735 [Mycena epipterygia]|nr:hypothetical protein C8R44DRAFT_870735 [Mycena epipterygia]
MAWLQNSKAPSISKRIRHNMLPSTDAERDEIDQSLSIARTRVSHFQGFASTSTALTSEMTLLLKCISEYSSLLAPIRRFPPEVLQAIYLDPAIHNHLSTTQHSTSTVEKYTAHIAALPPVNILFTSIVNLRAGLGPGLRRPGLEISQAQAQALQHSFKPKAWA